jgi:predicted secreted Zn-dependent protease
MKAWIVVAAIVLAGCNAVAPSAPPSPPSSPSRTGPPSVAPGTPTSGEPCATAVQHLGAFVNQVGGLLAGLRPAITTPSFDGPATTSQISRVSAALRSFDGLEDLTGRCRPTSGIGPRIASLEATARPAIDASQSASVRDDEVQRSSAATLFGLLSDVLAIGRDVTAAAGSLGLDARIAAIPDASARPLGSLDPLPTPTPESRIAIVEPSSFGSAFFGPGTTMTSYGVTGATPYALIASMHANGPFDRWVGQRAEAVTVARPTQHVELRPTTTDCTVVATAQPPVTFLFTITLPRWSPPKLPDDITVAWWNAELARAATHEKHHVDLWRAAAKRMSAAVATSSCATLSSQLGAIVREAARANCEFDLDEYGRELGLTIESCLNQ